MKATTHLNGLDNATLGQRLEHFLKLIEISKAKFCRRAGLDQAHLYRIIKGKTEPGLETITKFVKAFPFLSLNWLITGSGDVHIMESQYSPTEYELLEWSIQCLEYCPPGFEDRMFSELFKLDS